MQKRTRRKHPSKKEITSLSSCILQKKRVSPKASPSKRRLIFCLMPLLWEGGAHVLPKVFPKWKGGWNNKTKVLSNKRDATKKYASTKQVKIFSPSTQVKNQNLGKNLARYSSELLEFWFIIYFKVIYILIILWIGHTRFFSNSYFNGNNRFMLNKISFTLHHFTYFRFLLSTYTRMNACLYIIYISGSAAQGIRERMASFISYFI